MTPRVRRALVVSGSGIFLACTALLLQAKDARARKAAEAPARISQPRVQLAQVSAVRTTQHEELVGGLQPAKALQLSFEAPGRLAQLKVARGAKVAQGQVLAQLDLETVTAQVQQAEAALAAATAQATMARDTAVRQGKLQQGGSVSEWQGKSAEAQALGAEAQVQVARAALAQARAARGKHTLRAPFAGTVIDAPDQVGATIGIGAPLIALEQLDTLTLKITVPEALRDSLRVGARVRVESVGGKAQTGEARITAIIPSADATTRRVPVEIALPNHDRRFVAHTLARAVLPVGDELLASSVSSTALASAGGDHVFVLADDGAARRVAVTVLERGTSQVVLQGLPGGARVIDSPAVDLEDGVKVDLKE